MEVAIILAMSALTLPLIFGIEAILNYLSPNNSFNPHFSSAVVIVFYYEAAAYFGVKPWIASYFS